MEDEQRSEFVKVINQAMNNIYEAKVNYSKGSYEDPYLFICSKSTAKVIKKYIDVDKNNIFMSGGNYFELGIQELKKEK